MKKAKRLILVFLASVLLSNAVICDYELAKNEAHAAEVAIPLALDFLIELAITGLASYGIYVSADTLVNDTNFIDDFFANALSPEKWTVQPRDQDDLRKRFDKWCYDCTGYRVNWAQMDSDLNEVKEGIGGWIVNTGKRQTELLSQLAESVFNNRKLPEDPKWKKDMKTWLRAGLIGFAAIQGVNSLGDAINRGNVEVPGYTDEWYLEHVEGDDVVMPDADGRIQYVQRMHVSESVWEDIICTLEDCPSDLNIIAVVSKYYYPSNKPVSGGNSYAYLIGITGYDKGFVSSGHRLSYTSRTDNGLYSYVIGCNGRESCWKVPTFVADSTVGAFLNSYALQVKNTMTYDDWLAQQSEFQSDLLRKIADLELGIDELADLLEDLTDVITDPDIPPADIPEKIDPIINPEPVIPVNPDDPVPVDPVPVPDPVDPDNPTIEPGQIKQVQWTEFFPFCLVVDIIDCIKLFKATPRNPVFRIPFKYDKIGVDEEIVIDLTDYEDVWQVARTGQVILFIAGLIVLTKKFFF